MGWGGGGGGGEEGVVGRRGAASPRDQPVASNDSRTVKLRNKRSFGKFPNAGSGCLVDTVV